MDPQIGRAGFRIAFYVILVSGALLFVVPRGTAEFFVSVLSLLVGVLFAIIIGVLALIAGRLSGPRMAPPPLRGDPDEDNWV
ncbi:MAG: hypothetical protein GXP39_17155 [Chloroflexi bacterium]|nr:hypothetical protein [Chloroflexota bacterium]